MATVPNTYVLGSVATLTITIKDKNLVLTDAGTITLMVEREDGTIDGPFTPVHDSTGTYHEDYVTAAKGRCKCRVVTTSPTSAAESEFNVVSVF